MFEALLDQLKDAGASGDTVPNESLAKMLEDAKRMIKEMQDRNFSPQKTAAEKERDEAKKRTILSLYFRKFFQTPLELFHQRTVDWSKIFPLTYPILLSSAGLRQG